MNVQTITMDPDAAAAKLAACKRELLKRHSQEVKEQYAQLKQGYEALAKGTPLINPLEAIRAAGWKDNEGRPKLAIVRADQTHCSFSCRDNYPGHHWEFTAGRSTWNPDIRVMVGFEVNVTDPPPAPPKSGIALVPLIPPDVMPARGLDRSKHVILWEVESWDAAPPIDPMLLKPIGGGLYAVVAQWDLTPLEQEILREVNRI